MSFPKILTIAGSDSGGGAGVQADIKTATNHKVYAASIITCLTAQNTKKVSAILKSDRDFLTAQIEAVFTDIKFDAVKIGMLGSVEIIETVDNLLQKFAEKTKIILDPVMVATSGDLLLEKDSIFALKNLMKSAFLTTPNIDEAEILSEQKITNIAEMKSAAKKIQQIGARNVLLKGGHLEGEKITNILLDEEGRFHEIYNKKFAGKFHGTGCVLASAIASNLAKKYPLLKSVKKASKYVEKSVKKSLKIGGGSWVLWCF